MASQYDLPYTGPQVEALLAKISELESEMPSKTSDLTNDSGFITSADVPTKTSDLNNDSGFITNAPVAAEAARAQAAEALLATISSLQAEITRATGVEGTLQDLIDGIAAKIPSAATDQNQLADKAFVNSSIATATAEFRGTYDSLAELQAVSADENDYGYVRTTDEAGNTVFKRYKYASGSWVFEYDLNNSSFTASQWAAINSAITAELVEKLRALPTNAALTELLNGKQGVIPDLDTIRSNAAAGGTAYQKPSGGIPASDIADGVIPDVSGKVNTSDIADNLTTNDATKVLSAKQGKVLNENLTQLGQEVGVGELTEKTVTFVNTGYYIQKNGSVRSATSSYAYTDEIYLDEGLYYFKNINGYKGNIALLSKKINSSSYQPLLIDSNKSNESGSVDSSIIFLITTPGNYVLSGNINNSPKLYKISNEKSILYFAKTLANNVFIIQENKVFDFWKLEDELAGSIFDNRIVVNGTDLHDEWEDGFISSDGTTIVDEYSGYLHTDYIDAPIGGQKVYLGFKGTERSYKHPNIFFYEKSTHTFLFGCTVPSGDVIVAFDQRVSVRLSKYGDDTTLLMGEYLEDSFVNNDKIIYDAISSRQKYLTESNIVAVDENHIWNSNGTQNDTSGSSFGTVYFDCSFKGYFDISSIAVGVNGGGFIKNLNDTRAISVFSTRSGGSSHLVIPDGAKYLGITLNLGLQPRLQIYSYEQLFNIPSIVPNVNNQWKKKKIAIIGTSVAFGANAHSSYAKIAAEKLGATIVPACVPGLAIHGTVEDGIICPLTYGSSVLSKSEYTTARTAGKTDITIPETPIPSSGATWKPGGNVNGFYRTFENIFSQDNADVDLWLYAVAPNNKNFSLDDWNAFDKSLWKYSDNSPFSDHRTTFIGALLYLMNEMYSLNPKARMAFILDSAFAYANGKNNFNLLCEEWNIKLIDLWGKINTSPLSLPALKSLGGTDTHPSDFAHEIMGDMLTNELMLIA